MIRDRDGIAEPATIRAEEVRAVVPVKLRWPLAPAAIAIITDADPVVLAGSGVADLEPIRRLAEQTRHA